MFSALEDEFRLSDAEPHYMKPKPLISAFWDLFISVFVICLKMFFKKCLKWKKKKGWLLELSPWRIYIGGF